MKEKKKYDVCGHGRKSASKGFNFNDFRLIFGSDGDESAPCPDEEDEGQYNPYPKCAKS